MRKVWVVLLAAVFAAAGLSAQEKAAGGQKEKKAAAAKEYRWRGYIVRSNKAKSTLTVKEGNVERTVVYDNSTKWTKQGQPADPSEFKEGSRVTCHGKYDAQGRLIAHRIDLKPPRGGP